MLGLIKNLTYKIENRAANAGMFYRFASQYYRDVIEKEVVLAGINANDNVLCIGGGMCPFSAILIHQLTGARVTVIDNNSTCIPKAKQIIKRLGLSKYVGVVCGDGRDFDYQEYSVIHLALQVSPMDKVFALVKEKAAPGTRLLMRRPKKYFKDKQPYITHKTRNIGSTMLHVK